MRYIGGLSRRLLRRSLDLYIIQQALFYLYMPICNRLIEYQGQLINRCSIIPTLLELPPWIGMLLYGVFAILFALLSFVSLKTAYLLHKRRRMDFDKKKWRYFIILIIFGLLSWWPVYICFSNFFYFLSYML